MKTIKVKKVNMIPRPTPNAGVECAKKEAIKKDLDAERAKPDHPVFEKYKRLSDTLPKTRKDNIARIHAEIDHSKNVVRVTDLVNFLGRSDISKKYGSRVFAEYFSINNNRAMWKLAMPGAKNTILFRNSEVPSLVEGKEYPRRVFFNVILEEARHCGFTFSRIVKKAKSTVKKVFEI